MGNRKRYAKKQMGKLPVSFNVGNSVVVKPGVNDPDYGGDISGWQGRITELMTDEKEPPTVMIAWDSLTLKMLPESFIKESEREGLDWKRMGVSADQVELSQPRDTLAAVKRTAKEISAQYEWAHLGEEGERIQKVLDGANKKGEMAAFKTWAKYLNKILTFPFEAEVTEWQERGPLQTGDRVTILSFEDIEDMYGILANIKAKRGKYYVFPLCDLKAIYPKSPNYQPLDDYAVWFANR